MGADSQPDPLDLLLHPRRECYEEAVQRERPSVPPLPGLIDVDRLERVSVEIGRCSVCGFLKAVWRDKESGVNLCEGCWEREGRSAE